MWKFIFYAGIVFIVYSVIRQMAVKNNKSRLEERAREQRRADDERTDGSKQKPYGDVRDAEYRDLS